MLFFIRKNQEKLKIIIAEVGNAKKEHNTKSPPSVRAAIENLNFAYNHYCLASTNKFGKFLSFIPGTSAFATRLTYHKRSKEALSALRDFQKTIPVSTQSVSIRRSKSLDVPSVLPKVYPSPLNGKKAYSGDDLSVAPPLSRFIVN